MLAPGAMVVKERTGRRARNDAAVRAIEPGRPRFFSSRAGRQKSVGLRGNFVYGMRTPPRLRLKRFSTKSFSRAMIGP